MEAHRLSRGPPQQGFHHATTPALGPPAMRPPRHGPRMLVANRPRLVKPSSLHSRITLTASSCGMPRRGKRGHRTGPLAGPPPGLSRTRLRHLSPWGLGPATCVLQVRSGPVVAQPYLFPVPRPRAAPAHCYLDAVWAVGSLFCLTRWSWSSHWLPLAQVSPHPSFS